MPSGLCNGGYAYHRNTLPCLHTLFRHIHLSDITSISRLVASFLAGLHLIAAET